MAGDSWGNLFPLRADCCGIPAFRGNPDRRPTPAHRRFDRTTRGMVEDQTSRIGRRPDKWLFRAQRQLPVCPSGAGVTGRTIPQRWQTRLEAPSGRNRPLARQIPNRLTRRARWPFRYLNDTGRVLIRKKNIHNLAGVSAPGALSGHEAMQRAAEEANARHRGEPVRNPDDRPLSGVKSRPHPECGR